ncbi:MAG: ABC transporter ATP-binding protein [Candidatus Hecatellales archaeon]|nr:MAG: ABC transporter ATP-binding protein [Candidatus Hecatellales archaeon]
MLEVNQINVFYGDLQALWGVSLRVEEGEKVVLLGSNGAGKTTLLKTISGLLRPKSGEIRFFGERIDRLPPYKIVEKGISHVPEGRRLFPDMTVLENLMLGAYTPEAEKRMGDMLERVYNMFPILRERRNQLAETLSGGEQQMLAIGRALMSNPKLLLLDEPSTGLGPIPMEKVLNVLEQINKEGVTILLVEQNVHYALKLAERVYLLENGRIVASGSRDEIVKDEKIKKAYIGI